MEGYCFTFGAYRDLDDIDIVLRPTSCSPRRADIFNIRDSLSHPIFRIDGIMELIRDYLPCGAFLPTDLFPSRTVTTNEIYQALYSVACCEICTRDILSLIPKVNLFLMNEAQTLHLMYRCQFLKSDANIQIYTEMLFFPENSKEICNMIRSTSIHSLIVWGTCRGSYFENVSEIVIEGIKLRVSRNHYIESIIKRVDESYYLSVTDLRIVLLFGERRDMRAIRRATGIGEYYYHIACVRYSSSILRYAPAISNLGLEEMIVLSMMEYKLLHFPPAGGLYGSMDHMWSLPRKILQENCHIKDDRTLSSLNPNMTITVEYGPGRKQYTLSMESRRYVDVTGVEKERAVYICGNGVEYSYLALLLVIAKRFLFTYDRDYIISVMMKICTLDDIALHHLDTPSSDLLPPVHDLICPPDIFTSCDSMDDINSNLFQGKREEGE